MRLRGKLFINGTIVALTGLHVGGSKSDAAIGDIDNSVIKTSEGVPYIPGSSLKGKVRSLLEKKKGKVKVCDCGKHDCDICVIFGTGANKRTPKAGPTRLIVRDSHLSVETKTKMEDREGEFRELDLIYTEGKWENTIDRLTSRADNPRQTERVPKGAKFDLQLVFNLMENEDIRRLESLFLGLNLLEDDYLGGSGSRGYGRIEFKNMEISVKTVADYEGENAPKILYSGLLRDFVSTEKEGFKKKLSEILGVD